MTSTAEDLLAGEVIRPLRREEYEQLVALGAFDEEQVELLYGRIVEMPPQGPLHDGVIDLLHERLLSPTLFDRRAPALVRDGHRLIFRSVGPGWRCGRVDGMREAGAIW